MRIGTANDQRSGTAHFIMDQADCVIFPVVRPKRVGTNQFGTFVGVMGVGWAGRPHFMQDDRNAGLGQLPGGFATGKTGADDMDGFDRAHGCELLSKTGLNFLAHT